ncbi:hypothetical protein Celaphus_00011221, partial [Cervus elaphus hippelaphus]
MSTKESCGKKEKSRRKGTTPSSNIDEDKREKKPSVSSTSSTCSIRSVSSEKRKLKSDPADILCCNMKRKQELKRPNIETDPPRKRPKIGSSSQGLVTLQETSYSNNNQIISQSSSSNGIKKDISKCVDFQVKDTKLANVKSKLDHGIENFSCPKVARDEKPKSEGQASEEKGPHLLAQREKMKEFKKERDNKFRDSSEKCASEKCKKIQLSQDCNSNKIIKEPLESRRRRINFKIPVKSRNTLQNLVQENVFTLGSNKLKTKQEKKECPEGSQFSLKFTRHRSEYLFSDSTNKQTVHEWEGEYHEHQEINDLSSGENLTQMQIVEELHAARVGKSVDLPVVPPSGELMSMEIDMVEDDTRSSAGIPSNTASDKKLLIVIDTNILMNHLKFVRLLMTTEIPGFDRLVLIIPWVVVQELDRMKAGKLLKHAQHKAVPAVHFINDSLRNQDRKLWGQSIQLASQKL